MRAVVRVQLPDGSVADLLPGDIIGRLWTAALHLDDGRVSEAHALVSLRGRELRLLALRGRFQVDGQPASDLVLQEGQRIELAPGLSLGVLDVELPEGVLALEGQGLPRRILAGTCSLWTLPAPRLAPGFDNEAPAQLWFTGVGWRARVAGNVLPLNPGEEIEVEGRRFSAVWVPVDEAGPDPTRARGSFGRPVRLVASFDTVQVHREGQPALVLGGVSARILSELVAVNGPIGWAALAREIWGDADPVHTRRRWDVSLSRLRLRLREAGIRDDLVRSDGSGNVEIVRYPGDEFEDRT